MRIGFVTCLTLPEPDHDEAPLLAACARAGIETQLVAWDDPYSDLSGLDALVFRSCWNYYLDVEAFLAWVKRASSVVRLINSREIVEWNSHKRYLSDLAQGGCPVVPTVYIDRGGPALVPGDWAEVVVKPAVSAGSYLTRVFRGDPAGATAYVQELSRQRDVMVQPFLSSVATVGERSVVWIDGACTHAVKKWPRFAEDEEAVSLDTAPTEGERRLIERALACVPEVPLYARTDLMLGEDGEWKVSELELIEPSLFFPSAPEALERYVTALRARVSQD